MTVPLPSPRRRRVRLVRDELPPDDVQLVIRAGLASVAETEGDISAAALVSAQRYVVVTSEGGRRLLFGVSVFALPLGIPVATLLVRFDTSPTYLRASVGQLRSAGFEVLATGSNTGHFDVQLIPGRSEDEDVGRDEVEAAAAQLVRVCGQLRANPAYAGRHPGQEV